MPAWARATGQKRGSNTKRLTSRRPKTSIRATPPAAPRQQAQPSKVVAFPGPVKKPVVKKFGPGSYVTNAKFGRGQVVKIEGSGDDAKITVSFPGHGLKKLVAKYAGIKIE